MSVVNAAIVNRNAARQGHAYVVFLFLICFAFSYLDRQIVSIVIKELSK